MPHADREVRKAYMDAYNAKRAEKRKPAQRAWYLKNREKRIADQRAYHAANRAEICAKLKARRDANIEHFTIRAKHWRENNVVKALLNSARSRARARKLHFTLKESDIVIPELCPILGIPLQAGNSRSAGPNSPTLDRFNPKGFYTPKNVRVISWRANRLKSDGTLAEFERIVAYMRGEL